MPFHRGIEGKVKVEEPFYNYSPQILLRIHWRENLPHAKKRQLQARVTTVKKSHDFVTYRQMSAPRDQNPSEKYLTTYFVLCGIDNISLSVQTYNKKFHSVKCNKIWRDL